ncbi:MAG: L-sorbosone dehydrogenase [candidate division CPR1 bacterium GW2011_GWC1_49_13]|uniref:L-sorbosone dehydrogenase n=1 Tax=candidate division CPR1 bacterium GW2011_GWC1_49_13 TaxID=1618342 RepID=A0A0G1VGA6_9BACT|nr:MAG: L-sorbosone dehydrogenase [candidate division CPR1 bacterium GW2011_GWC1_49_13]
MRKLWLVPIAAALFIILLGAGLYFYQSPTSFLELFNFLNPPTLEPQGLIPQEELQLVEQEITVNGKKQVLSIPSGYRIEVFASGFDRPRLLAIDPQTKEIYVTDTGAGKVWNVSKKEVVVEGIPSVHGLAFFDGNLYLASTTSIFRFKDEKLETLVNNLPSGGHFTATLVFGPDGKMYVSRGSSCNVCEGEVRRAAILRFDKDGKNEEIFATGLRNDVGMAFHPQTGELWTTENGRDYLGDNLPPEEINIIKKGHHYGWPYCYSQNVPDPDFGSAEICTDKEPPYIEMQAHSAPLGLRFDKEAKNLYVAFHGSWNRTTPTGYKVVRISDPTGSSKIADYITGWRTGRAAAWGQPADVIFDGAGNMYISDDTAGVIYRLSKN